MLPLAEPAAGPVVIEGLAAAVTLDCDRTQFGPFAFGRLPPTVPLLVAHDPLMKAGEIERLFYDAGGQVWVKALVTHERARRYCGLSVAFHVIDVEWRDIETSNYSALVRRAQLVEISLVDRPRNSACTISLRRLQTAAEARHCGILAKLERCKRLAMELRT